MSHYSYRGRWMVCRRRNRSVIINERLKPTIISQTRLYKRRENRKAIRVGRKYKLFITMTDIEFTNEMLEKVLGGANALSNVKVYTFTGAYAEQQAQEVIKQEQTCSCGCFCNDGAGNGGGSGN